MVHERNSWLSGKANAIHCHSTIAVVIPKTLPSISRKGPPLFPGLTKASV